MKSIEIKRTILLAATAILLLASVSVFATTAQAQTPPQGVDTAERDDVVPEDKEDDSAPDSAQDGTPPTGVDTAERDDEIPEGKEDDSAPDSGQEGGTPPAGVDTAERDDVVPEDDGRAARAADLAPAPTGLRATTYTGTSVSLNWRAVTDAASYRVEYRKSGSSRWLVAGYASSGTSYKVSRLVCNATYYFQVRARGDGSPYSYTYGAPSTSAPKKTALCIVLAPTSLKSTASTETSVSLSWKAVANSAAYKVEYRRSGSSSWRHARYVYSGTSYDAPSLLCNTTYQFQVRARGNGKTYSFKYSDPSTSASKKTALCILPAPTSLKSTASTETSVSLSWKAVANSAAYKVEYRRSGSTSWLHADYVYSDSSYTVPSLLCNTRYQFQVRARGNGKTYSTKYSDPSTSASKEAALCTPSVPAGVSATASGPTSVKVSWSPVSGIAKYRVERRTGTSGSWSTVSSSATGPSYTVSGFVPGTSYYFRVSAYGDGKAYAAKWSGTSAATSTKTPLPKPPTGLSVSVHSTDDDRLVVAFTRSESPHYYEFELHRSKSESGNYARTATANDSTSPVEFDSQTKGYWYKARGRNCGTSSRSICGVWSQWSNKVELESNNGPRFASSSYSFSVSESAASGDSVSTVSATDADGEAVSYSLIGGNGDGKFAINSSSGRVTVAAALDYESTPSYSLTVQASDKKGGTATATVKISVTNVNEAPKFKSAEYNFRIAKDATSGATVGTVSATDPDAGDSVSYSILSGNKAGKFVVGPTSGTITVDQPLDSGQSILWIRATDTSRHTAYAKVTIDVTTPLNIAGEWGILDYRYIVIDWIIPASKRSANDQHDQFYLSVPVDTGFQINSVTATNATRCNWNSPPAVSTPPADLNASFYLVRCKMGTGNASLRLLKLSASSKPPSILTSIPIEQSWHRDDHKIGYEISDPFMVDTKPSGLSSSYTPDKIDSLVKTRFEEVPAI